MSAADHLKESALPVLLVDDEEIVLMALRDTLAYAGYEVVTSPHASHALSLIKERQFSVVISDQQMPLISGLEFLGEVMKAQPNATRILITAVLSLNTVIDAINKGEIYRFIVKPWLREELLATVRNAVQRFDLISSNARLQAETQAGNAQLIQLNQELQAQVATVAQQNLQLQSLIDNQRANLRQSVELAVQTMQTFYPPLADCSRRAGLLCQAMAKHAQLSAAEREVLEIGALIHDIGLIGVPRPLIKRWEECPGDLTPDERAVIERHPVLGQTLAAFVHHLREVPPAIRAHHERFDGKGYPDGLKGADIPWLARLLAVAVAHAHSKLESGPSVEMIRQASGSAFDPDAVAIFLRAVPKPASPARQRAVQLSELTPGMVLAQGIVAEDGMLLIPDGERLTSTYIDKLLNYHRLHPIAQSLLVYC